jgi:hypothetical protein
MFYPTLWFIYPAKVTSITLKHHSLAMALV